jgi:hypothetical protein
MPTTLRAKRSSKLRSTIIRGRREPANVRRVRRHRPLSWDAVAESYLVSSYRYLQHILLIQQHRLFHTERSLDLKHISLDWVCLSFNNRRNKCRIWKHWSCWSAHNLKQNGRWDRRDWVGECNLWPFIQFGRLTTKSEQLLKRMTLYPYEFYNHLNCCYTPNRPW